MTNPLARAIMGNNLKKNKQEVNQDQVQKKSHNNYETNKVDANLTSLLNDLIQGEKKVVESSSVNEKITLEEAADRVRKGL